MKGSRDESSKLSVSCPEVRACCSCSWAKTGNWALRSVKSQYLLQGPSQVSEQVFGHHEVGSMTKKNHICDWTEIKFPPPKLPNSWISCYIRTLHTTDGSY